MTEEEAKTKWCPHARLGSSTSGLGGFNRFVSPAREADFEGTRCLGSACMAFRNSPVFLPWVNEKGETIEREGRSYTDFYCGLAGKP